MNTVACQLCGVIGSHESKDCPHREAPSSSLPSAETINPPPAVIASGSPTRIEYSQELQESVEAHAVQRSRAVKLDLLVHKNDRLMDEGALPFVETEGIRVGPVEHAPPARQFDNTQVCVANVDSLTAALVVGNACVLNFANAQVPGGGYRYAARAQEEDLCRLLPQLYPTLVASQKQWYPIQPDVALLSRNVMAVRRPDTYERCESLGSCAVITSAMPQCNGAMRARTLAWENTVRVRIRAGLTAAKQSCFPNLILGAWGCGAFGNPPDAVAVLFKEQLCAPEFRGAFSSIVFSIIDPRNEGNLRAFHKVLSSAY